MSIIPADLAEAALMDLAAKYGIPPIPARWLLSLSLLARADYERALARLQVTMASNEQTTNEETK